ncbi:F-box family protein [Striga asiatica]|uniref:F-box family protein n=1 Tax=Striga asiatica TaxID=4170 RepID=A0A5A7QTB6_STRAF|nr:F-box family protein [Striga asiatica]
MEAASYLSEDLVVEILSKLPVQPNLSLVCRSWRSLILTPKFLSLHLRHNRRCKLRGEREDERFRSGHKVVGEGKGPLDKGTVEDRGQGSRVQGEGVDQSVNLNFDDNLVVDVHVQNPSQLIEVNIQHVSTGSKPVQRRRKIAIRKNRGSLDVIRENMVVDKDGSGNVEQEGNKRGSKMVLEGSNKVDTVLFILWWLVKLWRSSGATTAAAVKGYSVRGSARVECGDGVGGCEQWMCGTVLPAISGNCNLDIQVGDHGLARGGRISRRRGQREGRSRGKFRADLATGYGRCVSECVCIV